MIALNQFICNKNNFSGHDFNCHRGSFSTTNAKAGHSAGFTVFLQS
jgi:hypothetical protein